MHTPYENNHNFNPNRKRKKGSVEREHGSGPENPAPKPRNAIFTGYSPNPAAPKTREAETAARAAALVAESSRLGFAPERGKAAFTGSGPDFAAPKAHPLTLAEELWPDETMGEEFMRQKRVEEERKAHEALRAAEAALAAIPRAPGGGVTLLSHDLVRAVEEAARAVAAFQAPKTPTLQGNNFMSKDCSPFIDKQSNAMPLFEDNTRQAIMNVDKSLERGGSVMLLAQKDNGGVSEILDPNSAKNQGPTAEERVQIMKAIESLKGTPYPPDKGGLDCSHAVYEAYKNAGLHYEYLTSRAFPGKYFIEISEDELQPGDVVHWPGHVSIYKEGAGQNMLVIGARRPGKPLSETPARYFDDHGSRTYYRLAK